MNDLALFFARAQLHNSMPRLQRLLVFRNIENRAIPQYGIGWVRFKWRGPVHILVVHLLAWNRIVFLPPTRKCVQPFAAHMENPNRLMDDATNAKHQRGYLQMVVFGSVSKHPCPQTTNGRCLIGHPMKLRHQGRQHGRGMLGCIPHPVLTMVQPIVFKTIRQRRIVKILKLGKNAHSKILTNSK